tara:strand:+ start:426 stop:536 length:111 start_codon:yes stop_codon:yes gene_type:complete
MAEATRPETRSLPISQKQQKTKKAVTITKEIIYDSL